MTAMNSISKPDRLNNKQSKQIFNSFTSSEKVLLFSTVTFTLIVTASGSSLMFPFSAQHLHPRSSHPRALSGDFDMYTSFVPYNLPQYHHLSRSSEYYPNYHYHPLQGEHLSHISSSAPINIPIHRRNVYVFHDENDDDTNRSNNNNHERHHRKHSTPFHHEQDHFDYFHQPREKTLVREVFIHEGDGCLGGRLERLYENSGQCYTLGTHGPCGPNMIFQSLPNNNKTHGTCGCDDDSFDRPLVQFKNKCHFLYTQAYCAAGKWLSVDEEGIPQCETNPCNNKAQNANKETSFVLFHGKCVQLKSKSKYCSNKQVVAFVRGKFHPICAEWKPHAKSSRRVNRQIAKVGNLKCSYGKKYNSLLKKCVKLFKFRVNYQA